MICRGVLGRIDDDAVDVDWVDLSWPMTLRRALRLTSRGGVRVDVLLGPGGRLAHGDVLTAGPPPIAVCVEMIDVLAISVQGMGRMGRLAFDLGNRHLPAQIRDQCVLTPDDGPARELAASQGLRGETIRARFYPEWVSLISPLRG